MPESVDYLFHRWVWQKPGCLCGGDFNYRTAAVFTVEIAWMIQNMARIYCEVAALSQFEAKCRRYPPLSYRSFWTTNGLSFGPNQSHFQVHLVAVMVLFIILHELHRHWSLPICHGIIDVWSSTYFSEHSSFKYGARAVVSKLFAARTPSDIWPTAMYPLLSRVCSS